jgi:hypothetical protein
MLFGNPQGSKFYIGRIDFEMIHKESFISNNVDLINVIDDSTSKARDCSHNGKESQDIVIKYLLKKLNFNGIG